jgi:hypothetical protein
VLLQLAIRHARRVYRTRWRSLSNFLKGVRHEREDEIKGAGPYKRTLSGDDARLQSQAAINKNPDFRIEP